MTTGFLEDYVSGCFGPRARLGETFVQRRLMDVKLKYLPPDITDPEELQKQHDMFTVLKWKNAPTRQEGVSMDTLLQRMNDLERNMIATIRGGRNVRGQSRHPQEEIGKGDRPKFNKDNSLHQAKKEDNEHRQG